MSDLHNNCEESPQDILNRIFYDALIPGDLPDLRQVPPGTPIPVMELAQAIRREFALWRHEVVLARLLGFLQGRYEQDMPAISDYLGVPGRWGMISPTVIEDVFDRLAELAKGQDNRSLNQGEDVRE